MNTSTKIETKGYTNDQKYIWKKCKFIFMGKIERDKKNTKSTKIFIIE